MGNSLINGGRAAWKWTKSQVKAASRALSIYITIARADSKIRKIVKQNSKQRYWAASILKVSGNTYVEISSAISYSEAKRRVSCGLCVFAVSKSEARKLASNFPPVVGPEIGAKDAGQYMHYHVKGRKNKAHIFYLF